MTLVDSWKNAKAVVKFFVMAGQPKSCYIAHLQLLRNCSNDYAAATFAAKVHKCVCDGIQVNWFVEREDVFNILPRCQIQVKTLTNPCCNCDRFMFTISTSSLRF